MAGAEPEVRDRRRRRLDPETLKSLDRLGQVVLGRRRLRGGKASKNGCRKEETRDPGDHCEHPTLPPLATLDPRLSTRYAQAYNPILQSMALQPGTRLGTFEVLGPLGAGGMGEVYRARDTRLGREVAIKVLPESFARDPTRAARFEREARLLAAINHPAIGAIYGAEEFESLRCIIMELVPGETLAERLARGPIPLEEALDLARQIAEALEAAHEKNVIHRDLKPSNIKITPEGRVKVLDLGLAKAMEMPSSGLEMSDSPTVTLEQTREGTILGTVEFMSPEQARGKAVDKRTDIWAFGCILYEMLSRRRAFTGETITDVLAAIVSKDPDWSRLPAATPPRLRELLARCLQKDVNKRLRDIGDARIEMDRILSHTEEKSAVGVGSPWGKWSIAAILALLLAGGLLWLILRPGQALPGATIPQRSLVVLPAKVLGDYPGGQLIGDGLVETMSVSLNDVPGIEVVTPAAAVAASDKNSDPFSAARSVGASLVVRSSVVRSGERVRLIYSVWNVQTGAQVAGDTVNGSASDLLGMQDQLAENVAARLKLPRPSRKAAPPTGLETASEQERYLQALGALQRYDQPASIDRALGILEILAKERAASPLVQAALGRAALAKFNETRDSRWIDRASDAVMKARQLAASTPEVEVTLGELRLRTGQSKEAVAAFERALAAQPNSFDALLGLARACEANGDIARAEATYRRAVKLQPSYFGGYSKLAGFYYNHGRFSEAAENFRRVTELTPDNAKAFANLGGVLMQLGRLDQALQVFRKSVALAPTDLAWSNIGTLEYYQWHFTAAAEAYEGPRPATRPLRDMGEPRRRVALPGTGPPRRRSVRAFGHALPQGAGTNPEEGHVHSYLALALAKLGKIAEAREHGSRALQIAPGNPEFLYNAAVVAKRAGRRAEAIEDLRTAVRAGYSGELIRKDPEFAELRADRDFQRAVETARAAS